MLASAAFLVAEMLIGKTRQKSDKIIKDQYWKRWIENNVKTWGKYLIKFILLSLNWQRESFTM